MDPYPLIYANCDEYLCFVGGDITDMFSFNAEIELYMGEEEEKFIITSPTVVYVHKR